VILLGNSLFGKRLAWRPEDLSQPPMTIPTPAVPHRTERPWGWLEAVAAQPGFKIKRIGLLPGWVHRLANQTTNPLEIDEV